MKEKITLEIFEKAILRLKISWELLEKFNSDKDQNMTEAFQDSVIKRYEFTYEYAKKILVRLLSLGRGEPKFFEKRIPVMFREAMNAGLLKSNLETWNYYAELRNRAAHEYEQKGAVEIIKIIPQFLEEMDFLSHKLEIYAAEIGLA